MSEDDLQPSKLGTKEHWDDVYAIELENFHEIGDEGEVWFGEDSVEKMVDWVLGIFPLPSSPSILEVGSGNGTLLFSLHKVGYPARSICGIDYSEDAVKLAKAIGALGSGDSKHITYDVCDFLKEYPQAGTSPPADREHTKWDLVLDKGTFDAIALAERNEDGTAAADRYPSRISQVVKPGGYFLIVSCNFTEDELKAKFTTQENGLQYHSRIQFPSISFGGKSGSMYAGVAFYKLV